MQRTMRPSSSFSSFGSEDYTPYTLQDILLHWKNQNQASHRESQSNQMSAMLHPQEEVRQVPVNTIPTVGTSEAYVPGTSSLRCGEKSDLSSGMHHVQQRGRPRLQVHYRLLKLYEHSLICAATQGTCPDKHCSSMKDKLASANGPTIHKSFANWRKWFANLKRTYSTVGLSQALHNLDVPERTEVFGKRMKLDQASRFHPTGPNMEGFPPLVESSCQENNAHSNFVQRSPVQSSDSRRGCVKAHHILRAQWLLCLYLHSLGCSAQECPKPVHCNKMKIYVQSHFNWCNEKNCPRKCAELRGLVKHYTECCQSACAVCGPIRRNFKKDLGGGVNLPVQVDHPSPSVPQMDASTLIPPHLVESSSQIIEGDSAIEKPNEPLEVKMCLSELRSDPGGGEVHAEIKSEGVTFTEHFTLGQMKQHIQSLREGTGKGNAMQYAKNQDSCTLCGLEKLMFEPPCKSCSFCDGIIKRNSTYYNMPREHYCCGQCYKKTRAERFKVYGVQIGKTKLRKMRHDEALGEPWVECCKCQTWQHEICSLFNGKKNEDGKAVYTCPTCYIGEIKSGERLPLPESCVLGAKDLPTCILSDHLENRLAIRLRDERQQRAMNLGMDIDEAPTAENLLIRVVSSIDKSMKVSERFRAILKNNYPSEFPYRSKAIVLFQKIEGVDVLLFAMYVHEYGAECQAPNQRHVYISYLDSIKYFRPDINAASGEALRTFVYHEILIGYLDYVKTRGFTTCYIWASPPMKGDSYILHCRPTMQKIPKSDKLSEWYQAMLRKAIKEDIVVGVTNLYDQYFSSADESKAKITTARLPYFDGDYLPGAIEDTLNCIQEGTNDSKPQKKSEVKISRRTLKAAKSVNIHSSDSMTDILIMQKIGQTIEKIKNNFILAHLQPICTRCSEYIISGERWDCSLRSTYHLCRSCYEEYIKNELPSSRHTFFSVEVNSPVDTRDGDDTRQNEIFFSRHTFLDFCKDNNYQFDSLRRAKHSTMMCIYQMKKFQL